MELLESITFESQLTPPFEMSDFSFEGEAGFFTKTILPLLKPKIIIKSALGDYGYLPYGEPNKNVRLTIYILSASTLIGALIWIIRK